MGKRIFGPGADLVSDPRSGNSQAVRQFSAVDEFVLGELVGAAVFRGGKICRMDRLFIGRAVPRFERKTFAEGCECCRAVLFGRERIVPDAAVEVPFDAQRRFPSA
jgi:hypothetical protein